MSLFEMVKDIADWAIQQGGLTGAGVMMALESMIAPVPSEVVMPPLGFAVAKGTYSWEMAIMATSIGSLAGSLISYYMGYFGGKPLVMKVGKYLLLNEHHLDVTGSLFSKYGSAIVFVSRFIPVVRHLISIPAGIARMNFWKFVAYTLIGATIWNSFLLWLGYKLQAHWAVIEKYRDPIDKVFIGLIALTVIAWFYLHLKKPAKKVVVAESEVAEPEPVETKH